MNSLMEFIGSNRIIDNAAYENTYKLIKLKYGREILKEWEEKMDPSKYVYEDCGIASYLLELWASYNITPLKFADIGCGNGLLVYLLTREGIPGVGIDVRQRKIWTKFMAKGIDLKEIALDPSSTQSIKNTLGFDINFLIGNHCDELTPWIPIMAARLCCNFFLLPCCPFNFYTKFMKRTARKDQNQIGTSEQYYNYIKFICTSLGFKIIDDQLRIPSRKKKCIIGIVPENGLTEKLEEVISELLSAAQITRKEFKPRESIEAVRNCSKLSADFREELTRKVMNYLISCNPDEKINGWRCGTSQHLSTIIKQILTTKDRQMLSNQDKGFQTFLRNQHQVFLIENAIVSIRKWPQVNANFAEKAGQRVRQTNCWFHKLHPDGCPLSQNECSYKH